MKLIARGSDALTMQSGPLNRIGRVGSRKLVLVPKPVPCMFGILHSLCPRVASVLLSKSPGGVILLRRPRRSGDICDRVADISPRGNPSQRESRKSFSFFTDSSSKPLVHLENTSPHGRHSMPLKVVLFAPP